MKTQILSLLLGATLFSTSVASMPLFPKFLPHKARSVKSYEGYTNFSGHWVGHCDSDEGKDEDTLIIEQSEDFASITVNNSPMLIDSISTTDVKENFNANKQITHLRWSSDGKQLLGTTIGYSKEGNLSQGGFETMVGQVVYSLENNQLFVKLSLSFFRDGILMANNKSITCVYEPSNA